jgi:hypothetical protein
MPVILFTGATGDGKTHNAVKRIKEAAAAGRPVFTNIKGINEDGFLPIEGVEPIPINDNGELDWQLCPAADAETGQSGSLIVYDEAQKQRDKRNLRYFAHVNREKLSERAVISELDEHRHKGYDIIFITQNPDLLHRHLLGFVKEHYHFSRPFNKSESQVALWRSWQEKPNSTAAIERAEDVFKVNLEPEIFKHYKSTEQVTDKKVRIPKYMWKLGIIAVACFLVAGGLFFNFFSHFSSNGGRIGQQALDKELEKAGQNPKVQTALNAQNPELQQKIKACQEQFKWTAAQCEQAYNLVAEKQRTDQLEQSTRNNMEMVVYDYNPSKPFEQPSQAHLQPTSFPVFAGCMKKGNRYVAYTQQGTILHDVSQADCKRVVEDGDRPFNYFQNNRTESLSTGTLNNVPTQTNQPNSNQLISEELAKYQQAKEMGLI